MRRNPAEQLQVMHWFNKTGSSQQPALGSKKRLLPLLALTFFQILSIWETHQLHQCHRLPWLHMLFAMKYTFDILKLWQTHR
jgi:hypothetical protein